MWTSLHNVHQVESLEHQEEYNLEEIAICLEVGPWAISIEQYVYYYNPEPSHQENCAIEEGLFVFNLDAVESGFESLLEIFLFKSVLVLQQEEHEEKWVHQQ